MVFQPFCYFRKFDFRRGNTQRKPFQIGILCRKSNTVLSQKQHCARDSCALITINERMVIHKDSIKAAAFSKIFV